jgi:hypothetical protein
VKVWFLFLFLFAGPAAAKRPTAEVAHSPVAFWPINYPTGTVVFSSPTVHPLVPALAQAEHLRTWLTSTCSTWAELQTQADATQLYQGQLRGVHAGVALRFAVQVRRPPVGWRYTLLGFRVGAPTGAGLVQWVPLQRVLEDRDYQVDVRAFSNNCSAPCPDYKSSNSSCYQFAVWVSICSERGGAYKLF